MKSHAPGAGKAACGSATRSLERSCGQPSSPAASSEPFHRSVCEQSASYVPFQLENRKITNLQRNGCVNIRDRSIDLQFSDVLLAENMDVDLYTKIGIRTWLKARQLPSVVTENYRMT